LGISPSDPLFFPEVRRGGRDPAAFGRGYFNFSERPTALFELFDAETLERLREVKRRYDPDDVVRGNHAIGGS
jgi:hypothetical protein